MEKLHGTRATSDQEEYKRDRTRSISDVSTLNPAEEHSEPSKRIASNEMTTDNESDTTIPAENIPFKTGLDLASQAESDTDETTGDDWFIELATELYQENPNDVEAAELLQALTNPESSGIPKAVHVPNDPELATWLRISSSDAPGYERLERMWQRLTEQRLDNHLPLYDTAVLALGVKPGSLTFERYTVSWKASEILCFIEYTYQYKSSNLLKTWLFKACRYMLQDPGDIAKILHDDYVIVQVAEEQAALRKDLEKAKANLRGNIHTTGDVANDDWVAIACKAARHKALIRETNGTITKLRAAGFTRADLTLEKLSEFASNINSARLDLSTLVEYISSLPPIMEAHSSASTAVQSGGLDAQSLSDRVSHTAKRRTERKLKKKQAQQHAAQVMNTSQTEAMSTNSALSNNTMPVSVDQDEMISSGALLDDRTNTTEHTPLSTKKKNKKKKKGKQGKSQPMAGDHGEAVEALGPIPEDHEEAIDTSGPIPDDHEEALETSRPIPADHEEALETSRPIPEDHAEAVKTSRPIPADHGEAVEALGPIPEDHEEAVEISRPIPGDQKEVVETTDSHQMPEDPVKAVELADPHQIPDDHEAARETAEPVLRSHEEAVKTTDSHQQYPVFPLAEPSLTAMRNSPTTYAYREVQRPKDHRKVKSGTAVELQTLQLPSEHLAEAKERLLSEPSPLSLEEVRVYTREIEHHTHQLEQENSMKKREIVGIIRERSRSREAELLTGLNDQTTLQENHAATAMQETILVSSDEQVSDLDVHSESSNELLSVPVITRRKSMRRVITSAQLPTIVESRYENTRPLSAEDLALHNRVIHRRCHSEPLDTYKNKVFSRHEIPLGGHDDNEDLSDDESEDSQYLRDDGASTVSRRLREQHPYTPWTTTLEWKYYSNDRERRALPPGTRAYRFPHPVRVSPFAFRAGDMSDCPVYLFPTFTDNPEPIVDYNEVIDRYEITPHSRPWRGDLRSDPDHPDYLPPGKLCQYQAYEYAGFVVKRHDRDPFYCKLSSCVKMILDHDISTMICHGCGTKSRVRYCSKEHLIQDIPNHWKICGTPEEVYAWPIDPGSQPDRFYRRYPAIADIDEDPITTTDFQKRSYQRHRQQTYAIFNKGQYTLFLGASTQQIVEWPEDVAEVYKPRIERLLNMAFFRQANTGVVEYLFQLLRKCLRLQDNWTDATERILKIQFKLEFNYDSRLGGDADPCECIWAGAPALIKECTPSCRTMLFDNFGLMFGPGLKGHLENWEAKYWPLRIWQRQHPTIRGWEYRLRGEGFPGVPEYQKLGSVFVPKFGKGWEGYGAENLEMSGGWRQEF
ncbi:hypothetical protein MMC27_002215 [Xylographa pallens]|nr:hypothetical protein [Xylographa pallens]